MCTVREGRMLVHQWQDHPTESVWWCELDWRTKLGVNSCRETRRSCTQSNAGTVIRTVTDTHEHARSVQEHEAVLLQPARYLVVGWRSAIPPLTQFSGRH